MEIHGYIEKNVKSLHVFILREQETQTLLTWAIHKRRIKRQTFWERTIYSLTLNVDALTA
ncbi:hypothetical protein DERF_002711 [Dermatophagoides farinae]|uniref:Uncharacterized protein n=1 Tax=Dermatophagoides farinae TaxID=6954 RepID=A0A922I3T4_DERFA|nr:hypothetical protein DERF_004687 [Dermatophagoides farinae]KAH9528797.1 hypothetical protein DERF_002711 [Dermatophagoides farinae]